MLRNSAKELDPKEKSQEAALKKVQDLCVNNARKKKEKKRERERNPKNAKPRKCCVIPPKPSKPEASKDTGSPERIAPADSRPTQTASHKQEREKSRLASLGKRLKALRALY
jgi:hypothetical protein